MKDSEIITLLNENKFTEKEINKLVYAAKKEAFTVEQTVSYLAGEFYRIVLKLMVLFIIAVAFLVFNDNNLKANIALAIVYLVIFIITCRKYSIIITFKAYKLMDIIKSHKS